MPDLQRIAFVLEACENSTALRVVYILIGEDTPNLWKIGMSCDDAPETESAQTYANMLAALFSHAIHIKQTTSKELDPHKRKPQQNQSISIAHKDRKYGKAAGHVYNVIEADADKKYTSIPPDVRKGLKPLLAHSGARGKHATYHVVIASDCQQRTFFWDINDKCIAEIDFNRNDPVIIEPMQNHFDIDYVHICLRSASYAIFPTTWQYLYLQTIVAQFDGENRITLKLSDLGETSDNDNTSPKSAFGTLINTTQAILCGPSGSGKTTLLKQVATHYAKQAFAKENEHQLIPILISLKDFELQHQIALTDILCDSICSVLKQASPAELHQWYANFTKAAEKNINQSPPESLFIALKNEIRDYLSHPDYMSEVVLLVDELSDIMPGYDQNPISKLQDSVDNYHAVILAIKDMAEVRDKFKFENKYVLLPLTGEEIIPYIKARKSNWQPAEISDLPHLHPKLFELLGRPFYLKLFCESDNLDIKQLPTSSAKLIESFIRSTKHRKGKPAKAADAQTDNVKFNSVISILASKIIAKATIRKEQQLYYPADFTALDSNCDWQRILHTGNILGILTVTEEIFGEFPIRRRIRFDHDLFRDCFAALWLRQSDFSTWQQNQIDEIIEYKVWDTPIQMYFELLEKITDQDGEILLKIAKRDPYLAASCVEPIKNVSAEIIHKVIEQVKRWECDFPDIEKKLLSNEGVSAAKILFSKLPAETANSFFNNELKYSLEFLAIPYVLAADKNTNISDLVSKMCSYYTHYPTIIFDIAQYLNEPAIFRGMVRATDHLISKEEVPPASALKLIRMIMTTPYELSPDDVSELSKTIKDSSVKNALYFKARHLPHLERLADNANADIVRLICAFTLAEQTDNNLVEFVNLLQGVWPDCLSDQVCYFMIVSVATRHPNCIESLIANYLDKELAGVQNLDVAGSLLNLLAICGTDTAVEIVAQKLCTCDAKLITNLLFSSGTCLIAEHSTKSFTKRLIRRLAAKPYMQAERSPYLRFTLGERISEEEQTALIGNLDSKYEHLSSHKPPLFDKEFELMAACMLSCISPSLNIVGDLWHDEIMCKIAPAITSYRTFARKCKALSHFFEQDAKQSIECAINLFLKSPFMECDIDAQATILRSVIHDDKIEFVMQVMWNRISRDIRRSDIKTRYLLYWYRSLQKDTRRRWLVSCKT